MSSTGKGQLIRSGWLTMQSLRTPTFQETINGGPQAIANDFWRGGFPPTPTQIPYSWLSPPARFRSDQPRNVAQISRTGGATARAFDRASVAAVGERPFSVSLDTAVDGDMLAYAQWLVGNYTEPRQRMPQLGLNLTARTPTECWLILGREIGDRISITDAPGSDQQLVGNPWFESGTGGWTATGCVLTQSSAWSRSGSSSLLLTPDGVTASVFAEDDRRQVIAGADYVVDGWLHSPGGYSAVGISVNWYDTSNAYLSTSSSISSIGAGFTSHRVHTFTAPAGAVYARVHPVATGTPAAGNTLHADEVTLTGPTGPPGWPAGVSELVIEGIANVISGDARSVVWNTAPLVGASSGEAGPWLRLDDSRLDIGANLLAF